MIGCLPIHGYFFDFIEYLLFLIQLCEWKKKNSFDLIIVIMLWKDWWDCIENLYVEYNIVS